MLMQAPSAADAHQVANEHLEAQKALYLGHAPTGKSMSLEALPVLCCSRLASWAEI